MRQTEAWHELNVWAWTLVSYLFQHQWAVCCLYLIITAKNNSKPKKTLWNSFQDCRLYFKLAFSWDDSQFGGVKNYWELFLRVLPQLSKHASWPNEDQIILNAQKRLTDGWPRALKEVTTVILVVRNQKQLIIKKQSNSPTERIENTPRNALWHTYSSG